MAFFVFIFGILAAVVVINLLFAAIGEFLDRLLFSDNSKYTDTIVYMNSTSSGSGSDDSGGSSETEWNPFDLTDGNNDCPDCGSGNTDGNHCYDSDEDY